MKFLSIINLLTLDTNLPLQSPMNLSVAEQFIVTPFEH